LKQADQNCRSFSCTPWFG